MQIILEGPPIAKKLKVSKEKVLESYKKHGSVWKAAEELGMCGQNVHVRLKKYGIKLKNQKFSEEEKQLIISAYSGGDKRGEMKIKDLARSLNRSYHLVVREAGKLGLTNKNRKASEKTKFLNKIRTQEWHSKNPHPRGMLGKKHSDQVVKDMRIRFSSWYRNATQEQRNNRAIRQIMTRRNNGNDKKVRGSWKASWRTIGGKTKFFRSRWEANYARYLEYLKTNGHIKDWEHEPQTFWFESIKRGVRSYLPDFKVFNTDETHYWVEVKGYMDDRSKTKISRFKKYYKNESLKLIDSSWFRKNSKNISLVCKDWE